MLCGALLCVSVISLTGKPSSSQSKSIEADCRATGVGQFQLTFRGPERASIRLVGGNTLIMDTRSPAVVQVENWKIDAQPVFEVFANGFSTVRVASRRVLIPGSRNLRDLGGYLASGGKSVRWATIFRSDDIATSTVDATALRGLQLKSKVEIQPNPAEAASRLSETDAIAAKLPANATSTSTIESMGMVYAAIPQRYAESFRAAFDALKADRLPLIVFGGLGKDEVGVLSALILNVLGVDRATILADYELSNRYLDPERRATDAAARAKQSPDVLLPLFTADRRYLESALRSIDAGPGGWLSYRRTVLGVSDRDQADLRRRLLQ